MARYLARLGAMFGVEAFLFVLAAASPVRAQQPSSVNPTASAVQEQKLSCFTREAVKRFNRTLPSKVDKTTVLQSVSAEGVTMTYHYRVDVDRADIKPAALEAFKGTVRGKVCAAQDMHTIIRVGGKYRYLWLDKNGKLIGSMIVDRC